MWERGDGLSRQQGIGEFEEGIGAAAEAPVQGRAKGTKGRKLMGGHGAQLARYLAARPLWPPALLPWVKSQA